jgi:hypothetical protein
VKLALLLGDIHVLKEFDRLENNYCFSSLEMINSHLASMPVDNIVNIFEKLKSGMNIELQREIFDQDVSKYYSIHPHQNRIEFRSPGGDWINTDLSKLERTINRFVVVLYAAGDPAAYRNEYLKKLYSSLVKGLPGATDIVEIFSQYVAKEFDQAALKKFLIGLQQARANQVGQTLQEPTSNISDQLAQNSTWDLLDRNNQLLATFTGTPRYYEAKERALDILKNKYPDVEQRNQLRPFTLTRKK